MEKEYTLEKVKELLEKNQYDELNKIIYYIKENDKKNIVDIEILKYLSESNKISQESREELTKLKDECIEEVTNNIIEENKLDEKIEQERLKQEQKANEEIEEAALIGGAIGTAIGVAVSQKEEEQISEENNIELKDATFKRKLEEKGLTIRDYKNNVDRSYITFEINNISKPYIDNLMLRLYENKEPGIGYMLTRIDDTKEEFFTIDLNGNDLAIKDRIIKSQQMFEQVEQIIDQTDRNNPNKYEEMMPDALKNIKSIMKNDAPDIPKEGFKLGYRNDSGIDNFYVMAPTTEEAKNITRKIGYEPSENIADGIVRINTELKNMENTKVAEASFDVTNINNNQTNLINTVEKTKVKSLGSMPVRPEAAYTSSNSILLVIVLIIMVILIVGFMVMKQYV